MRNYRLNLTFLVFATAFVAFFACNKYKDAAPPSTDLPQDKMVTASLQGRVLDENGVPVQGAAVTSGTASTTTDVNGVFNFSDIQLSSRFGFVKVVKQGYFAGSRSILTSAGSANYVTITLLPRTSKGTFPASGGGTVVVATGDSVTFDATSVVVAATNAAYGGTVHVYAAYLDPTAKDMANHMPGDLRGIGVDGKETLLQSFGMMVVELEGDAGEKLQIAPGKLASLSMVIPQALKATVPSSLPLWYFNDTTGRWIEQGTATRKGDQLCGQTSHFSWWNCDAPTATVNLKVRLKDQQGNPMAYIRIQLTSPTFGTTSGYTDASGNVSGLIPKGQTLQLQVISSCGSVIAGANVGPALQDLDLGTLTVTNNIASLTLSGTVADCYGGVVDSGYVNVVVDGLNYRGAVSKGAFSVNVTRCLISSTQASLVAGNYKTLQQGSIISLAVDTGKKDVGQLTACGTSITQYISVTIDGKTYTTNSPPDSVIYSRNGSYSDFWAMPKIGSGNTIGFRVNNLSGTGDFSITGFYLFSPDRSFNQPGTVQCTVSQYGAINEFITGDLSGTVRDTVSRSNYPMTGSFKMIRTY